MVSLFLLQKDDEKKPAFAEESRSTGAIKFSNYWKYFRSGAGYFSLVIFTTSFLITQVLFLGTDYWLTLFTNAEELRSLRAKPNVTDSNFLETFLTESNYSELNAIESSFSDYPDFLTTESSPVDVNSTNQTTTASNWMENIDTHTGVYVYSILVGCLFVFTLVQATHFFQICMSSSAKLHNKMFESIIRSQLAFFDQNPVGKKSVSRYFFKFIEFSANLLKRLTKITFKDKLCITFNSSSAFDQ